MCTAHLDSATHPQQHYIGRANLTLHSACVRACVRACVVPWATFMVMKVPTWCLSGISRTFFSVFTCGYREVECSNGGCRHQWFQTQTVVEVAVLAKNMTKERVDIQIDKQHLRVVIRDAQGEQEYELDLDLYGEVSCFSDVEKSRQQSSMLCLWCLSALICCSVHLEPSPIPLKVPASARALYSAWQLCPNMCFGFCGILSILVGSMLCV